MASKEDDENLHLVEIQCSRKRLKTLFYCDPSPAASVVSDASNRNSAFDDLLNCPGVVMKIVFPCFELSREIRSYSQYKLILEDDKVKNQCVYYQPSELQVKKSSLKRVTFISSFICEYLKQIKRLIEDSKISSVKKTDLLCLVSEFLKDISLCNPTINVGTEYFKYLTTHPYVRYVGRHSVTDDNCHEKNKFKPDERIRLQETFYPVLNFSLTEFGVFYNTDENEKIKFLLKDCQSYFLKNKWVILECKQCEKVFSGFLASYELREHLTILHGIEPDWTCTMCGKVFTAKSLSITRWQHDCEGIINQSNKNIQKST